MPRRRMLDTFDTAKDLGPYDEYPVLSEGVDPQLHLSVNDRPQPFHLTCGKDCILVQMSGKARLEMRDSSVLHFNLVPGDYAYVPAGTPHRIVPSEPSIQYRYKAEHAGLEAATFYCDACGTMLLKDTWDTADEVPQAAYLRVVTTFNADESVRRCSHCGHANPAVDLAGYRWQAIVEELAEPAEAEAAW